MTNEYDDIFEATMQKRNKIFETRARYQEIEFIVTGVIRSFGERFDDTWNPGYVVQAIISWEKDFKKVERKIVRSQTFRYEKTAIFEIPKFSEEYLTVLKEILTQYFDIKELNPQETYLNEYIRDFKRAFKVTLKEN